MRRFLLPLLSILLFIPSSQSKASGSAITTIVLSGNVSDTAYNWIRNSTASVTGIASPKPVGCTGESGPASVNVGLGCTIICPANITKNNASGRCGAQVNYPAATTSGICAGKLSYSVPSGSFFPVGSTQVIVTSSATSASCSFTITVKDTEKPVIESNQDTVVATSESSCSRVVNFSLKATDNCSVQSLKSLPASGSVFPLGTTVVTVTATDASGNTRTATFKVKVKDSKAPVISGVSANPVILWPADHSMKNVTVNYDATDNCGNTISNLSVTSNEPINGTGQGDKSPDWKIVDAHNVQLRAERSPNGTGRIYTIKITSQDASGNVATQTTFVTVPLNNVAVLRTIAVTPTNSTVPAGSTLAFTAVGTFSDGSTQDLTGAVTWLSSDNSIAVVANGIATGVSSGTTTISAQYGSISGSANLNVTNVVLMTINVTPTNSTVSAGGTLTFIAAGHFSDGSTQDLTGAVTWSSSDNSIAVVANGIATGVSSGTTTISAQYGSISGSANLNVTNVVLMTINVTPTNSTVLAGHTLAFTAAGSFSDGSTQDLTGAVTWSSSDNSIAVVANGIATGVSSGTTTISAQYGSIAGSANLNVTNVVLITIDVTPTNSTVSAGHTLAFTAAGSFSDGSTQDLTGAVTWSSSDNSIAVVANGIATGVSSGTTTISAQYGSIAGSANLNVTNVVLITIDVTPTNSTVSAGHTLAFTAVGSFSDGSTQDLTGAVTWLSSDNSIAVVANGIATGVSSGTTTISAQYGSIAGSANLNVTNVVLITIDVTPTNSTVLAGHTLAFTAVGTFSDGSAQDLTGAVTWSSSDNSIAVIANGIATGISSGSTTISAQYGSIAGSANLNVTPPIAIKQIIDARAIPANELSAKLTARLMSNPTEREFNLVINGSRNDVVEIRVFDITGREVERMKTAAASTVKFGQNLMRGTYIIELSQGREKVIVKAVKQ